MSHVDIMNRLHLRPSFNSVISISACFAEPGQRRKVSAEKRQQNATRRRIEELHELRRQAAELGISVEELRGDL